MSIKQRKPLESDEVVVHVPVGTGKNVRIQESDAADLSSEIVVQVSKKRTARAMPVLGVIVK